MTPLLPLALLAVTLACPPSRVPTESTLRLGAAVRCDLDGDGVADRILVSGSPKAWGLFDDFEVQIGGARLAGHGASVDSTFAIVDIDRADARLEIAITEQGRSDDYSTRFFTLDGDSILDMGTLPGSYEMTIDGSGIIHTMARGRILHTWFHPSHWRLDSSHRLVEIELPLYAMNSSVRVLHPLSLQRAPHDRRRAVRLHAGENATILASDDRRWCLVRAASGAVGWFAVDEEWMIGGREARDTFEGLSFAD